MKILVTGSDGFVGRNLIWNLKAIRDQKNNDRPGLQITEIYRYDVGATQEELEYACRRAEFVFHLAGVSRPKGQSEFMENNYGFTGILLETLKKYGNKCPVLFSSSSQASLAGRFAGSEYGRSKLAGEELLFQYAQDTGAKTLVYRFPNLFGKWCRPNYNSVVATFCHAIANDLAYTVDDPDTELELLYIDDLVHEMLDAIQGNEHRCEYRALVTVPCDTGCFCYVPITHRVTLRKVLQLLHDFRPMPVTLLMPEIPADSFEKKLYATYLSYLPKEKLAYSLHTKADCRGTFTELIKTESSGQISINITKPGQTRGEHWHNSKWEIFIVVSGHGLIRERRIGLDPETDKPYPVVEFEVTGEQMKAVQMIPGYTHNIVNLSKTESLITVIWANERFDASHADTFYEPV